MAYHKLFLPDFSRTMMHNLAGKHILVGISGGISAYKIPEFVRQCRQQGAEVRVMMTDAATQFITPLTLQTVSGHEVLSHLFAPSAPDGMDHIELARWADCLLIAPATASSIAKLAQGMADDLLGTVYLATTCPVLVAPAMNVHMWQHPATRNNLLTLKNRGVHCVGPNDGIQACGDHGTGRMSEPDEIMQALNHLLTSPAAVPRMLISAGPTYEDIDPVRFIGNRSSGKMGYALARACQTTGAHVTLVSGPVCLPPPTGITVHAVRSAADMHHKIHTLLPQHDIFIGTAAVADYRPAHTSTQKIKKQGKGLQLTLEQTPDIIKEVADRNPHAFIVGFAAESENMEEHALNKMHKKGLDLIIANPIGAAGSDLGMDSDTNQATVYWENGQQKFPEMPKSDLATQLITLILEHYCEKNPTQNT